MAILEELRKAIQACGQSYSEIETATGVSKAALSRFVNNTAELGVNKAEALALHFGLSLKPDKKRRK
jgi:transcriptional regulator with XRE-family HTH domain